MPERPCLPKGDVPNVPYATQVPHLRGQADRHAVVRLEGEFSGCRFCELSQEESRFLLTFIKNRGSIKDVEREMGVSYPTVRAALDGLIASLGLSTPDAPEQTTPAARAAQPENAETPDKAQARRDILNLLAQHRITAAEAASRLRGL